MSDILTSDQADDAREIAEREVTRFGKLLSNALTRTPLRADGAMNHGDLLHCVDEALERYEEGSFE